MARLNFGLGAGLMLVGVMTSATAMALPAFPGAEGFGAVATGGRGGQVIKVTTLNANGPGSLQAALDQSGPRIIVFAVSGVIKGDITVSQGDVTIAGQTAPGAGITIEGQFFGRYSESVNNIIVRHIRVRPRYDGSTGEQFDAIQFSRNSRLILDHISVSWGIDETVDLYSARDVTVQWSTIEESGTQGHPEGIHNYGLINGPDGGNISLHHNLFIHHKARSPAIATGPAEVVNNVAYNVRHGFVHHNAPSGPFNISGNCYLRGGNDSIFPFFFDDEGEGPGAGLGYYLEDNLIEDPGIFSGVVDNPWQRPLKHPSFEYLSMPESLRVAAPHDFSNVAGHVAITIEGSKAAMDSIQATAGAMPRDVVTKRMMTELTTRGGSWGADEPVDLMAGLTATEPPADADGDGMPDSWEQSHGLDPNDGSDHSVTTETGYTAIEDYINELAGLPPTIGGGNGGSGAGGPGGGDGPGSNGYGDPDEDGRRAGALDEGCAYRMARDSGDGSPAAILALGALALGVRRRRKRS